MNSRLSCGVDSLISKGTGATRSMKKPRHVFVYYFRLTFVVVVACFIWLAVTNAGNPAARHGGTIVTYAIPAYWIMICIGQAFIGVSIYTFVSQRPGFFLGREVRVGSIGDRLMRLIPALIGSAILAAGVVSLARHKSELIKTEQNSPVPTRGSLR